MIEFVVEWQDEPRVRDRLLRATWARLEIRARDRSRETCLTSCVDERSRSLRHGVYGSVFPLAEWVLQNWWFLLEESSRIDRYRGGRAHATDPVLGPWTKRHNLLVARGGFALPDLTIYRDGDHITVRCIPDPLEAESDYPVRFVADAELRLEPAEFERALRGLVETVSERVREQVPAECPECAEYLSHWEAIQESARSESPLCAASAALGIDPYDPSDLTDSLAALLEGPFEDLSPLLKWDLAESSSAATLETDLGWVRAVATTFGWPSGRVAGATRRLIGEADPAHLAGYSRARRFRDQSGAPPFLDDIEGFLRDRCGWDPELSGFPPADGVASRINGAVGLFEGRMHLASPTIPALPATRRFLLGRALFFAPDATHADAPRLLTRASSWSQRASRAFAAELLAPSVELGKRVSGPISYEQVGELARDFRVSEMVIEHQLENHRIASVVDL